MGPISVNAISDAQEKADAVADEDVKDMDVLDVCCATGAVGMLLKIRGARSVIGIERMRKRYVKVRGARRSSLTRRASTCETSRSIAMTSFASFQRWSRLTRSSRSASFTISGLRRLPATDGQSGAASHVHPGTASGSHRGLRR
ncbi:MAG: class I SAM-dependent methyltransferase [Solirubrobacterales bacterium]